MSLYYGYDPSQNLPASYFVMNENGILHHHTYILTIIHSV